GAGAAYPASRTSVARTRARRRCVCASRRGRRGCHRPAGRYQQHRRLPPQPRAHAGRTRAGERAMTERRAITLTVNGNDYAVTVEPRRTLVDTIRDDCGLTGTHIGCEHGVCGSCTVLLDDEP